MPITRSPAQKGRSKTHVEVYLTTDTLNITDNTPTKVSFTGENHDELGEFATGTYTCKQAGIKNISGCLQQISVIALHSHKSMIYKNGSLAKQFIDHTTNANNSGVPFKTSLYLNVGDTLEIYAQVNNFGVNTSDVDGSATGVESFLSIIGI